MQRHLVEAADAIPNCVNCDYTHAVDECEGLSRDMGVPFMCGCNSGELGVEKSDLRLAVSGSTSDIDPCLFFLPRENALLNELLN